LVDQTHQAFRGSDLQVIDPVGLYPDGQQAGNDPKYFALIHGTSVGSLLFGSHKTTAKGIAPRCKGVIVPVYRHEPDGSLRRCSQATLATAIRGALNYGAHVINISGGEVLPRECANLQEEGCRLDSQLVDALRECEDRQVLVFAAAGNDGCDCIAVPAAAQNVTAVGAMSQAGEPLEFSNWGSAYQENGILAPGKDILVAAPNDRVVPRSGTSVATPIVAGVAAILLSLQLKRSGTLDHREVRRIILETADRCDPRSDSDCKRILVGRLNVGAALAAIKEKEGTAAVNNPSQIPDDHNSAASGAMTGSSSPQPTPPLVSQEPPRMPDLSPASGSAILPYDCGCGGNAESSRQPVYVVGKINYDIPLPGLQDSLNAMLGLPANTVGVLDARAFIQYLLGGERRTAFGQTKAYHGAIGDAESVVWTLEQDGSPVYAIQPTRAFADQGYKQLIALFIEQAFGEWPVVYSYLREIGARPDCLYDYFHCYSGETDDGWPPLPKQTTIDQANGITHDATTMTVTSGAGFPAPPFIVQVGAEQMQVTSVAGNVWTITRGHLRTHAAGQAKGATVTLVGPPPPKAAFAAFPGEIVGKVRLRSGQVVEVISPVMRGTQNWATERLLQETLRVTTTIHQDGGLTEDATTMTVASGVGFPQVPFVVQVGAEQMQVTSIAVNVWTITRGFGQTRAAVHANGASVTSLVTQDERDFYYHLVSRLNEETRNFGRSPEERTKNYAATNLLSALVRLHNDPNFRKFVGGSIADIWVDSIQVLRNERCRTLSECYDFELKLFDGTDILKGRFVVAGTVDVKPVVPVLISDLRLKVVRS
jgi:hypothetical protein